MCEARALSLHQPWASLVALGVKGIEMRSWSTKYRGRLLIHAAKRNPTKGSDVGGWMVHERTRPGGLPSDERFWLSSPDQRGCSVAHLLIDTVPRPLPLGAVVASGVLTDCVPMAVGHPEERPWHGVSIYPGGDLFVNHWNEHGQGGGYEVTDQAPFGDFSPGRFAWLLGDVKPTTERCPRCWVTRTQADDGYPYGPRCSTCEWSGACEPVPMRGRQQLWAPTWT